MPETTTPATESATPADPSAAAAPTTPEPETEPDWKAESRKWETRAKENKAKLDEATPKLTEYDRLVEASKSDAERLQEAAEAAKAEAQTAREETIRLRVAIKHGISDADLDLLGSGTEEQLDARAARLAALNAAAGQPGARPPAPNPAQGAPAGGSTDPAQQLGAFIQRQLAGG